MLSLKNKLALLVYDTIALSKGYRFVKATTKKEHEDAGVIYSEDGFTFPESLKHDIQKYKAGTVSFIAYYKNTPVGVVRLADPNVINRPYELYGVDHEGKHYEIQSLTVRKGYRDGAQFVLLGMVKKLYAYSISKGISSWSACGTNTIYLSMRRYCKKTEVTEIDFKSISHPLTSYLYAHNIIETYFTMDVSAFAPWLILKKCVKKIVKKWDVTQLLRGSIEQLSLVRKQWNVYRGSL
jgi:hypothetical protein